MRAHLPLRLARSAAFAVVCVLLAAGAHWFAGGASPTPQVLLTGGLVVMAIVAAMAGVERSSGTVIGLLLAAQVFLHELFDTVLFDAAQATGDPHEGGLGVSLGMTIAHLTATLITGWWLARGEAALWSVLRMAGSYALHHVIRLLAVILTDPAAAPGPLFVRPEPVRRLGPGSALRHVVTRRGPPILDIS